MHITIIAVGLIKEPALKKLANHYITRLNPLCRLHIHTIKDSTQPKETLAVQTLLLKHKEDAIFLLDEYGKTPSSMEFTKELEQITATGKQIVFVIGPAAGLSQQLKDAYPRLALSAMTFTHEMAHVLLLEQLYRAHMILAGKPYHKA